MDEQIMKIASSPCLSDGSLSTSKSLRTIMYHVIYTVYIIQNFLYIADVSKPILGLVRVSAVNLGLTSRDLLVPVKRTRTRGFRARCVQYHHTNTVGFCTHRAGVCRTGQRFLPRRPVSVVYMCMAYHTGRGPYWYAPQFEEVFIFSTYHVRVPVRHAVIHSYSVYCTVLHLVLHVGKHMLARFPALHPGL